MSLSYRNQSINLLCKSIDWFYMRRRLVVKGLNVHRLEIVFKALGGGVLKSRFFLTLHLYLPYLGTSSNSPKFTKKIPFLFIPRTCTTFRKYSLSEVFLVKFELISHLFSIVSIVDFEQVNVCWERITCSCNFIRLQQELICSKSTKDNRNTRKRCEISSNLTVKTSDEAYFRKARHVPSWNKRRIF